MRAWGVTYYKMDGLSIGAGVDHVYINDGYKDDHLSNCQPLHDRTKTNIEAMRLGLKTIRQGAGDDVFFSGCCASQNMRIYAGAIGLVDSMRVGPDFNHDGQGIRSGPLRGSRDVFHERQNLVERSRSLQGAHLQAKAVSPIRASMARSPSTRRA